MLNHELLISKGFKLNEYPEGKYYELETTEEQIVEKILVASKMGYEEDEKVILQLREDFGEKLICVDGNVWVLTPDEFYNVLSVL